MESTLAPPRTNYKDIHQLVTDTIIQQLEKGVIPWQKPWIGSQDSLPQLPVNYATGNNYRGINILLLWTVAINKSYNSNEWASFKQWQSKGETIRKGEKGSLVVYYDKFDKEVEGEIQKIPFIKSSYVFNRIQVSNYQARPIEENPSPASVIEKIDAVETFVKNTSAVIEHHDGGACYIPSQDKIKMPYPEKFIDSEIRNATEAFYSVLLHELTHWSGSEKRLNRIRHKKYGDQQYAAEELTAEFGAAFLCAGFGLRNLEKGDHSGYIDYWLKILKDNKTFLFTAAGEASKAVEYLHALTPTK